MQRRSIQAKGVPDAIGPYSPALQVGPWVFISGQLGMSAEGELLEGVADQTRQALENAKALLVAAGLDLSHVVRVTIYLARMEDFETVNSVYETFFSPPYPARAAVEVSRLPKDALVEIEMMALRGP